MPRSTMSKPDSYDDVRPGRRVVYRSYHGSTLRGRVVMRSSYPDAWVVNLGGRYGTPGILTRDTFIRFGK
jgi:hypothetical protein